MKNKQALAYVLYLATISLSMNYIYAGTSIGDDIAHEQHAEVMQAIAKTEVAIEAANNTIERVREQVLDGNITAQEAGKVIIDQTMIIVQAKQELKQDILQAIEKVSAIDENTGYLNYFISGAKNIGTQVIAPLKDRYYGHTEFERKMARKTIKGLVSQQEQLTQDYEEAMDYALTSVERETLKNRYEAIIAQLNNEIHQQKIITGEEMTPERKLFWAAVGTGATLAGIVLLTHYSGKEVSQDMLPTVLQDSVSNKKPDDAMAAAPGELEDHVDITLRNPVNTNKEIKSEPVTMTQDSMPTGLQSSGDGVMAVGLEENTVGQISDNHDSDDERFIDYTAKQEQREKLPETLSDSESTQTPVESSMKMEDKEKESMSLQQQADMIGKRNRAQFIELYRAVEQAQTEFDKYKVQIAAGEGDSEMLNILEGNVRSAQQAQNNFFQQATQEKENFERKIVGQQQQEELQKAGQQMVSDKEEERRLDEIVEELEGIYQEGKALEEADKQQQKKEQEELQEAGQKMEEARREERKLDEESIAMEAAYNEEQEKNTKLINDSTVLVEKIRSDIEETMKAREQIGDKKEVSVLQNLDNKYANIINAGLAEGRNPQEIYADLVDQQARLQLQLESNRLRALSATKSAKQEQEEEALLKTIGITRQ